MIDGAGMHVVVYGNPFDGMTIVGPFTTGVEAVEWASDHLKRDDWWAMPLVSQDSEEVLATLTS